MKREWIIGCVLVLGVLGCGGVRPRSPQLLADFERYRDETEAQGAGERSRELIASGTGFCDEARPYVDRGRDRWAAPLLEMAVSDGRLALAVTQAEEAARQADVCLRRTEQARRRLEEALRTLVRTQEVAGEAAWESPRQIPGMDAITLTNLPPTTLEVDSLPSGTPEAIDEAWEAWSAAAVDHSVPIADLASIFESQQAIALAPKTNEDDRFVARYRAERTLQTLETRVRIETSRALCYRALYVVGELNDARDEALLATLELERGLRGDLRTQLEDARVQAENRQNQLYEALHQIEGRFARISQEARGTIVSLADILFDFDQATLKRDVEFSLVRVATILNQFPEMNVQVEGHTDNIGAPEYNLDLSQRRARAVYDFLVSQNVPPERLSVEGYGMTRPVADNGTEEGRQRNRRVDLVIQDAP